MNFTRKERDILTAMLQESEGLTAGQKQALIRQLEADLDQELSKPDCDVDLANSYVDYIGKLKGIRFDEARAAEAEARLAEEIRKHGKAGKTLVFKRFFQKSKAMRNTAIAAVLALVLIGFNFIVAGATGRNLFSEIIQYGRDHVVYNFAGKELLASRGEESIYSQLRRRCEAAGVQPHLPASYPRDAKILTFKVSALGDKGRMISFTVGNGNRNITVHIQKYTSKSDIPALKIPDTTKVKTMRVGAADYYISKASDFYNITAIDANCVYNISSFLPYNTTVRMIQSIQ